jgi:uncharacterized protein (TIGR02001 family)
MKKKITTIAVTAIMLVVGAGRSGAAETSVSVDLASAYVFRGTTFNDGLVVQPGLETASGGFTVGIWGNLDVEDYDGAVEENAFSEIDLYGSYSLPIGAVDLSVGYTEYTYPGAAGEADREVSLIAGFDLPVAPSLSLHYGVDGGIEQTLFVEAGVGDDFELGGGVVIELGATVGYLSQDAGASGFSHFSTTLGASYGILSAGVTYVGQIDSDVLPNRAGAYDADLYGTVGVAHEF